MGNTFGHLFRITTWGESHGGAIGVVIDGCPPKLKIDIGAVQAELDRRRPGQSHLTTSRQEEDQVEILSGVFEGQDAWIADLNAGVEQRRETLRL